MKFILKYLQKEHILIWPFFLFPFLPTFFIIDKLGIYYLYLSLLCLAFQILFLIQKENIFKKTFFLNRPLLIFYISFLIWQIFSLVNAINLIEGIIEFFQYFTLFNSILILSYLSSKIKNINSFLIFILLFGLVECFVTLKIFFENFTFEYGLDRIRDLEGLSSNQNFNAFAILSKIPISIYFLNTNQKKVIRFLMSALIALQFFLLFVIASRASLLCLFLLLIILIILHITRKKLFIESFLSLKHLVVVLFSFMLSFGTHFFLYENKTELRVQNRINSLQDASTNYRILNYKEAIDGIIDYPIFGVGIGNWKIISLKYAQNRIENYEIPKHVHNDFLHIAVETGILGGILFLSIFASILFFSFKQILLKKNQALSIVLLLLLTIYCFDSLFNFPRIRPYSQLNFFVITIVYSWIVQNKNNE